MMYSRDKYLSAPAGYERMKLRRQQAHVTSNEQEIIREAVAMGYCK